MSEILQTENCHKEITSKICRYEKDDWHEGYHIMFTKSKELERELNEARKLLSMLYLDESMAECCFLSVKPEVLGIYPEEWIQLRDEFLKKGTK
jgi:hypothetical protein